MIFSVKGAGPFDAQDLHRPLDDANQRSIAARIGADGTWGIFGEGATGFAQANTTAGIEDALSELLDRCGVVLDQVQSNSLG